jgi:hypothetical protein
MSPAFYTFYSDSKHKKNSTNASNSKQHCPFEIKTTKLLFLNKAQSYNKYSRLYFSNLLGKGYYEDK